MEEHKSSATPSSQDALLRKIRDKREELKDYLARIEPRHARLINASIVSGAAAAALTAGPGVGGAGFIAAAKGIVSVGIPVWQVLCLLATLFSVAVIVANAMLKSHDLASRIGRTRTCDAKLEGLETMLELNQIGVEQATQRYTQCLAEVPHI